MNIKCLTLFSNHLILSMIVIADIITLSNKNPGTLFTCRLSKYLFRGGIFRLNYLLCSQVVAVIGECPDESNVSFLVKETL